MRLNSLRHGLRARTVVLPGEDRQEFQQLCDDLETEWQPRTRTEQFYVEQMAVAQWKLTRMEVGEADLFQGDTGAEKELQLLHRLWQAQNRLERSYAREQRELQALQNARLQTAGFEETCLEADPVEASAARDSSEEIADAGSAGADVSPDVHQPASRLPYAPIQTRDLIAKLYPSQRADFAPDSSAATPEPDVAYGARGLA